MRLPRQPAEPSNYREVSNVRALLLVSALIYTVFVIYGSLVPLEYRAMPLDEAMAQFRQIRLLKLGIGSRADWVANLLLYIPLTFLWAGVLTYQRNQPVSILVSILVVTSTLMFCIGLEFTQLYFPPRTVSLNDLYAGAIGGLLGILLWMFVGKRLVRVFRNLSNEGTIAIKSFLFLYFLAYLFLSLFPFDFVLSAQEWRSHLASEKVGWLLAGNCSLRCLFKLVPEVLAAIPIGLLLLLGMRTPRPPLASIAMIGLLFGLAIETFQLTIESGISQGSSAFARSLGMVIGAILPAWVSRWDLRQMRPRIKVALLFSFIPFLFGLAHLNHWFAAKWVGGREPMEKLSELSFIPFYYHYYTAEAVALVSVIFQSGLYAALGAAVWLWREVPRSGVYGAIVPASMGFVIALIIEIGKLFVPGQHPDPTNILIAFISAGVTHALLTVLYPSSPKSIAEGFVQREIKKYFCYEPALPQTLHQSESRSERKLAKSSPFLAFVFLISAGFSLHDHPLGWTTILPFLITAVVLWKWQGGWLMILPAAMPLLDFSPFSGRLFWTEFDTLLLLALAAGYSFKRITLTASYPGRLPLSLFVISAAISLAVGILPLSPLDMNAFTHYTSPYNALRTAKSLFLSLAFWPLLKSEWQQDASRFKSRLALGMSLGLALEIVYVLWERVTYSGLWNVDTDYRITGSFSSMHIGGASIEAYLVLALPFVLLRAWQMRRPVAVFIATGLYALGAYGVMVTFSRGGQAAFILATLVALIGFARLMSKGRGHVVSSSAVLIMIVVAVGLIVWPIVTGKFSQARLTNIKADISIRSAHWKDSLDILDHAGNPIFGAGLGTFPAAFYWYSSAPTRPASYGFSLEEGNPFLRLGGGESLYFEQIVAVRPGREYRIQLDLRSQEMPAALTVPLCEKALLYSFTCAWNTLDIKGQAGKWAHYEIKVKTDHFGPVGSRFQRPVKLSMFNQKGGTVIDVDNVALIDEAGRNLVENGDFSQGMQQWFFSTDSHLAWHAKNLFIHVLFEQGWLGLIAFISLIVVAMTTLIKRMQEDAFSLTLFVSLTAFMVVGTVDSLVDDTRLGFLFYWLIAISLVSGSRLYENIRRNTGATRENSRQTVFK